MDWNRCRQVLTGLHYGKRLPATIYLHRESAACRTGELAELVSDLAQRCAIDGDFNVVKFRTDAPRLSFLSYPTFDADPTPPWLSRLRLIWNQTELIEPATKTI